VSFRVFSLHRQDVAVEINSAFPQADQPARRGFQVLQTRSEFPNRVIDAHRLTLAEYRFVSSKAWSPSMSFGSRSRQ